MDNKYNDELAEYTDRILAGEDMTVSADNQDLAQVVQQIHSTIRPNEEPSTDFRDQLRSRLVDEFNRSTRDQRIVQFQRQRMVRRVAQVAAVVVVVGAVTILLNNTNVAGTAGDSGSDITSLIVAMVVVAAAGVVFWLFTNRQN